MKIKTRKIKVSRKELPKPIPAGMYKAEIISCRIVGSHASVEFRISQGKFKGRKVFDWLMGKCSIEVKVKEKGGLVSNDIIGVARGSLR